MILTLREYAQLTTAEVEAPSFDRASISPADFDELCELNEKRASGEPALIRHESRSTLRLRNYVGVLELKSGTCLEILPKTCEQGIEEGTSPVQRERALLFRMLSASLNITPREGTTALLQEFPAPLFEWVIRRFLLETYQLLKHGLRFDYKPVDDERPFLRGRLDVRRLMLQPPQKKHLFPIHHNVFSVDRPEHRLLKRALNRCLSLSRDGENLRLAAPLYTMMASIPPSSAIESDLRQWSTGCHMAHYQHVRPWCELVLGENMPFALSGRRRGISMLFPMERLFEKYVATCLRQQIPPEATLQEQLCTQVLCSFEGRRFFALTPDILINHRENTFLIDTKWKMLSAQGDNRFGIRQSDFYQLYAYGQNYLGGTGDMALLYPHHSGFPALESPFLFLKNGVGGALRLWILGWDLQHNRLNCGNSPFKTLFPSHS